MHVDARVLRGPQSWAFFRWALGIALFFETIAAQMIAQPFNYFVYGALPVTVWLFMDNGWVHDRLIGMQHKLENKAR